MNHIYSALIATSVWAEVLGANEKQAVELGLLEQFGVDIRQHAPWDNRRERSVRTGRLRPDGWQLIPEYVGTSTCIMFLDEAKTIWKFKSGADLLQVLEECPAFEFYVCDENMSYLLCSNDHDFIIGWGTAAKWVGTLDDA